MVKIEMKHVRRFNRFMMFCMATLGCMIAAVAIPKYEIYSIGMLFSYALLLISYHFMLVYSKETDNTIIWHEHKLSEEE